MIVTIRGTDYKCRTATMEGNVVTLYLGDYDKYGEELVSRFVDFPPKDIIGLEIETQPSTDDVLEALLGV